MRTMTSRQIHDAIEAALKDVSQGLASGELDRRGRYYTDSELKERLAEFVRRRVQCFTDSRKSPHRSAKSA